MAARLYRVRGARRHRVLWDLVIAALALVAALLFFAAPEGANPLAPSVAGAQHSPQPAPPPPPPPQHGGGGGGGGGGNTNSCSCVNGVCSGNVCPKPAPPPVAPPPPAGHFAPPPPQKAATTPRIATPPAGDFAANLPAASTLTPTAALSAVLPTPSAAAEVAPDPKLVADSKPADAGPNRAAQAAGGALVGGSALAIGSAGKKRASEQGTATGCLKGAIGLLRDLIPELWQKLKIIGHAG